MRSLGLSEIPFLNFERVLAQTYRLRMTSLHVMQLYLEINSSDWSDWLRPQSTTKLFFSHPGLRSGHNQFFLSKLMTVGPGVSSFASGILGCT